jgi:hypothetical protein
MAAYCFFNIIFSFTYTPLQGVIPAEALETTMRAKGLAASGVIVSAIGFINQFAGPIALGNIKNNYMYVFVGWDAIESLLWYFFWSVSLQLACFRGPPDANICPSALNPKDVLSKNSSGYTARKTQFKPRNISTRSLFRQMAQLLRRSLMNFIRRQSMDCCRQAIVFPC